MQLLSDFLSAIIFLTIYGVTDNLCMATGAAIAVSITQFTVAKIGGRLVDLMQWLVLGMVVVLGSATLIIQDSRFIMMKPSIVHFAVGAVMLRRGWMMRLSAADRARQHPQIGSRRRRLLLGGAHRHRGDAAVQDLGVVRLNRRHRRQDRGVPHAIRDFPHHRAPRAGGDATGYSAISVEGERRIASSTQGKFLSISTASTSRTSRNRR